MSKIVKLDMSDFITKRNLLQNPLNLNTDFWIKYKSRIDTNIDLTPCNTRTADKLCEDNTHGIHGVIGKFDNNLDKPKIQVFTGIAYLKLAEREFCRYYLADGQQLSCVTGVINLRSGEITKTNSVGFEKHSFISVNIGNGWWKIKITAQIDKIRPGITWMLQTAKSEDTYQYIGDDNSGIYIWGVQLIKNT